MTQLMNETLNDLRSGRETWRVLVFLCSVAFVIAFTIGLNARWV
jgi:hypothetical protein